MSAKSEAIKHLDLLLSRQMQCLDIESVTMAVTAIAMAFGPKTHTFDLAKSYLTTIVELKKANCATANTIIPIISNLLYPAFGADPIKIRKLHAPLTLQDNMNVSLRWDKPFNSGNCQIFTFNRDAFIEICQNIITTAIRDNPEAGDTFFPAYLAVKLPQVLKQ